MSKKKNLLNPTPAQVVYRNRLWAQALLANHDKEGKNKSSMYNNGRRCCLAVAQDVAHQCGLPNYKGFHSSYPHRDVARFFGWLKTAPMLNVQRKDKTIKAESAIDLNDGVISANKKYHLHGLSHRQIAECVMNTYVHPSKPKFSFSV